MSITIHRPDHGPRRPQHIYQVSDSQTSGKSAFMDTIALIGGGKKVAIVTGVELASPLAPRRVEGKEVLLIEGLMPHQRGELRPLLSSNSVWIEGQGEEGYTVPNTIRYIFYVMVDRVQERRQSWVGNP